jgi:hypothetical protein
MPEKTPFRCPEFSCRKKFTTDIWRLKHIKLHHPEHLQVAHQKNLTICSAPRCIEPAQHPELNANKDSVEDFDAFAYHEHVEIITDSETQPPPPLPQTDICSGASAPLIHCRAEPWEPNAQGCLETNQQINPYFPIATHIKNKYI